MQGWCPILASTDGAISSFIGEEENGHCRRAVAARLAVAPGVLIDVITGSIGSGRDDPADEVARLGELVRRAAADFARRAAHFSPTDASSDDILLESGL